MFYSAVLASLLSLVSVSGSLPMFTELPVRAVAVNHLGNPSSDSYVERWRYQARRGWDAFVQFVQRQVPPGWQNAVTTAASIYPFAAIVLLLFPRYRKLPKEILGELLDRETFPILLFGAAFFGLSAWAWHEGELRVHQEGGLSPHQSGSATLLHLLGIPAILLLVVLGFTSFLWVPLVLLFLPAFVFAIISLPFKLVWFLVIAGVKAPIIFWHYLHYLFVPHPAETAYNAGMARQVPLPELAADVANAMYQYDMRDYDRLPRAWRSRNWQRRIEAFHNRIRAENDFMQELERNIRLREQSSMNRR